MNIVNYPFVLGAQKNRLIETILLSAHHIFRWEIRTIISDYALLSGDLNFAVFFGTQHILRRTIEGYLGSVLSLTFNTIKTKLIMPAFYSSRYLQSKSMLNFRHALMVEVPYTSKWCNHLYWKVTNVQKWLKPISTVSTPLWLAQNHCLLSLKSMAPNFVVVFSVLLPICCHIGSGMPYLWIFVEETVRLLGPMADKWGVKSRLWSELEHKQWPDKGFSNNYKR